jgi:hypothetical protein
MVPIFTPKARPGDFSLRRIIACLPLGGHLQTGSAPTASHRCRRRSLVESIPCSFWKSPSSGSRPPPFAGTASALHESSWCPDANSSSWPHPLGYLSDLPVKCKMAPSRGSARSRRHVASALGGPYTPATLGWPIAPRYRNAVTMIAFTIVRRNLPWPHVHTGKAICACPL